jgi:hypothetical protein
LMPGSRNSPSISSMRAASIDLVARIHAAAPVFVAIWS